MSVLPSLPRVGLDLTLPGDFETVTWYGRGPGESYADSKQSSLVGRYERDVTDLHTPYVRPQANGNRTDVRWAAFTDESGVGLRVTGDSLLDVTAHRYTTADLEAADHVHELPERDEISVSLDHTHCGLGTGLRPRDARTVSRRTRRVRVLCRTPPVRRRLTDRLRPVHNFCIRIRVRPADKHPTYVRSDAYREQ
ncbi:beta-galactosidase small subunit [Halosimplex aquaticum]